MKTPSTSTKPARRARGAKPKAQAGAASGAASGAAASAPAAIAAKPTGVWGIQVGAFSSNDLATRAVNDAYALAKPSLTGAQMAIAGPEKAGAPVYRARMGNINESQAKAACQTLIAHSTPCFAYKIR